MRTFTTITASLWVAVAQLVMFQTGNVCADQTVAIEIGATESTLPLLQESWSLRITDHEGNRIPFSDEGQAWQGERDVSVDAATGMVVLSGLLSGVYEIELATGSEEENASNVVFFAQQTVELSAGWNEVDMREQANELLFAMEGLKVGDSQTEDGLSIEGRIIDPDLQHATFEVQLEGDVVGEFSPREDGSFAFETEVFVPVHANVTLRTGSGVLPNTGVRIPSRQFVPKVIYVDARNTGHQDGLTWSSAFKDPNVAIRFARNQYYVPQVWIAKGRYPVSRLGSDLPNGIKVFGGFIGTENWLDDRNPSVNKTVFTGDVDANDQTSSGLTLNVTDRRGTNTDGYCTIDRAHRYTRLDGIVFTGFGKFNSVISCTNRCSALLRNLEFVGNEAFEGGGLTIQVGCRSHIEYCRFQNNKGITNSGAIELKDGETIGHQAECYIENCEFVGNRAQYGGASNITVSRNFVDWNLTFASCRFVGNQAEDEGGAICQSSLDEAAPSNNHVQISNSLFNGNSATWGGAISHFVVQDGKSDLMIEFCTFDNNQAGGDDEVTPIGSAIYNRSYTSGSIAKIHVADCIVWDSRGTANLVTNEGPGSLLVFESAIVMNGIAGVANKNGASTIDQLQGSSSSDPRFRDANGADNIPGTDDDDLRLQWNSPAIEYSSMSQLPQSWIQTDLDGASRLKGRTLDTGCYEFQ